MSETALRIVASACAGPWGHTIEEMAAYIEARSQQEGKALRSDAEPPLAAELAPVPGFIESAFNPLVYRMIQTHMESGGIRRPEKLAIVLASAFGDTTTADSASRNLLAGQVHNPLLFYQSVPNSILGYASRQFGLTGQMTALAHQGDGLSALLELAALYSELPSVEQVLVIGVELRSERADELLAELAGEAAGMRSCDQAVSLLLERNELVEGPAEVSDGSGSKHDDRNGASRDRGPMVCMGEVRWQSAVSGAPAAQTASAADSGVRRPRPLAGNQGLAELAIAAERISRGEMTAPATVYDDRFGGGGYAVTLNR